MNISNEKIIYCKNVDGLFLYPGRKNGFTQKESVKNTNSYSEIYDTMKQAKCRNTNEIIFDMFQNADILEKEEAMKIEKKLWITLFVFGLFAICFSGWIFSQSTTREKLFWDNTIQCETKELSEGEIKSENIALPEDFDIPRSILFKTTHTIAEVWLDGEKIYEYGNEPDAPGFMKTPGSCWHIVDIPGDSAGKSLEVRIIPVYEGYYGNEVSLVYGTQGDCILKILTDSLGTLVISCGILFAAVICLLLYCGAARRKRRDKIEAKIEIFLNLGFFSFLVAI